MAPVPVASPAEGTNSSGVEEVLSSLAKINANLSGRGRLEVLGIVVLGFVAYELIRVGRNEYSR